MSLRRFLTKVLGNANERELGQMQPLVDAVNDLESTYEALSEANCAPKTDQFQRPSPVRRDAGRPPGRGIRRRARGQQAHHRHAPL